MKQQEIIEKVTESILTILENGELPPWCKPWKAGLHKNLISGKAYRGINQLNLQATAQEEGYNSSYWLTFQQCKKAGGHVRKGEHSSIVIKWLWFSESDEDGEPKKGGKKWATQKYFRVFNADQCEGLNVPEETTHDHEPLAECEKLIDEMPLKPSIEHSDKTRACYSPRFDRVNVPGLEYFDTPESYYATMFHELGHSTGHISRLARKEIMEVNFFGSHDYSKEELCAESCAAFLSAITGIETQRTIDNAKTYIKGWLSALKDDRKMLIYGIQQGQKAADYIQGIKPKYEA